MAQKKKKEESNQLSADSDQQAPPPALPILEEHQNGEGAEKEHYTKGTWAGLEQFRCKHCEFDTLELDVMVEHLFWMHSILLEIDPKENQ